MSPTAYRACAWTAYVALTVAIAVVLHSNPFGTGTIDWIAAIAIAAIGNAVLAFVLAPRIGPYLVAPSNRSAMASRGADGVTRDAGPRSPFAGPGKAPDADPARVRMATFGTGLVMMLVSLICVWGVGLAASDPIIVPTERLERNAELARATIKQHAPAEFQATIGAADTWIVRKGDDELRTCVPAKNEPERAWCVRILATDESARVLSYGPGKPNAQVYLEQEEAKAGLSEPPG